MKQGSLNARIVMLVVLAAVVITIAASALNSLRDLYPTVTAYSYAVDDSLEATGFLVRAETVLPGQGGTVEILPEEGEKVSLGETVALLYQSDAGLTQRETLQQLLLEQEQLEYALAQTGGSGDSAQLSSRVADAIASLRGAVASGDLTGLESQTMELKSLVYKRSYTFGEEEGDSAAALQASLDEVNAQINTLTAQTSQNTSRVTAAQSGIFSGLVDGYESLITPAMLETLTPAQLEELARQRPAEDPTAIGKLITNSTWYFTCTLSEGDAARLVEGRTVTVRFSRDWSGEVDMKVERLSDPEGGRWRWCCPPTSSCPTPPCCGGRRWIWSLTPLPVSACPRRPCGWISRPSPTARPGSSPRSRSPGCTPWWASGLNSSRSPCWQKRITLFWWNR